MTYATGGAAFAATDEVAAVGLSTLTVSKSGSGSGTVTSNVGGINCGATCSGAVGNGAPVTFTATPGANYQFMGWLGPCTGMGACQFTVNAATTVSATFGPPLPIGPRLDIDWNNVHEPLADGLLILRYLFNLSGNSLINGAIGAGANRTTAPQITSYLNDIRPALDIDGNGQVDPLTDGLLILRQMFGLSGNSLINQAVGANATRSTAVAIESQLQDLRLPMVTRGPYLQVATPTSMTVRWRTNIATTGRVRYGTSITSLGSTTDAVGSTIDHEITLTGLTPDTRYYYSVGQTTNVLAAGPSYRFVTPPPAGAAKPMRIWVIGDAGTGTAAQLGVRNAYETFNGTRETDLTLFLGDNAYGSGTDDEYQAYHFYIYPDMLRNTASWYTLGNHEALTGGVGAHPYYTMFSFPTTGQAGGVASGSKAYNSFNYGNIHFINLDSMETDRSGNGAMATWLLSDLQNNTLPWIIAFWHHPPYSKGTHDSDPEVELAQMRANFLPILEQHGVDLVLAGHSHVYERSYLLDGHYGLSNTLLPGMKKNSGSGRPR